MNSFTMVFHISAFFSNLALLLCSRDFPVTLLLLAQRFVNFRPGKPVFSFVFALDLDKRLA